MKQDAVLTIIRELVQKMGIDLKDIHVSVVGGHTLFTLATPDSGALIGTQGETLHALNHMVKKVLEGKEKAGEEEAFRFVIDVNGYHLKHIKMLEADARGLAERARLFKHDVEMSPMSPYDRMIVHASLQGSPFIRTESQGEGKMRHIVIKYGVETPAEAETEPQS